MTAFLARQLSLADVVDVAGGCRLQKLERWIVEADQKLVGRHDFLVDKGGRLPRNGTSQIAKDHDCNDEQAIGKVV